MNNFKERKKVNFMISKEILKSLHQVIPAGERSDFVNEALEDALIDYSRKKAFEQIEKFRKEWKLKMTTDEIIKLKNYGRE